MTIGKEIGEFSLKQTSSVYAEDGTSVQLAFDGTATGFGTVLGTLTGRGEPGADTGTCTWRSQAFLEDGEVVDGMGEGYWDKSGKHKWRIRGINRTSDGRCFASDGVIDLASRSFKGKLFDWS